MTEKRFTSIRKKNPVTKEMGNYIQDNCTTILKLGFFEDCKDVCDLLNEQHEENIELKHDNKRLVEFIMSKGYTLRDYLDWLQREVWE